MNRFQKTYDDYKLKVEDAIGLLVEEIEVPSPLKEAMEYSLTAGGKRLRPVLLLAAYALLRDDDAEAMPLALAVEMIHTYSLIHDDLPAMDDDSLRRGKPTNHIIFGEAMAILAGDGLLSLAFERALSSARKSKNAAAALSALYEIARGAGVNGMVAGQCLDISSANAAGDYETLKSIHAKKTGALIVAAVSAGLVLGNPTDRQLNCIRKYGENLGLAFQITDDLLDVTGDMKELGKEVKKDKFKGKLTYPAIFGVKESFSRAAECIDNAVGALDIFGEKGWFLAEIARGMLARKN